MRDNRTVIRYRRVRQVLSVLLPLAALTACGTLSAHEAEQAEELAERARKWNVSPDLVFVTEADGYDLAIQSAGVHGDDAFQSVYVSADRSVRRFTLTADHGGVDATSCPGLPLVDGRGADGGVRCARDGDLWYRTAGTGHEYAKLVDDRLLRVTADRDAVDRDTLRAAAEHAHAVDVPATSGTPSPPQSPVERGDLPPHGDGASLDPPAVGG